MGLDSAAGPSPARRRFLPDRRGIETTLIYLYFETDVADSAVEAFKLRGVRVVRDVHDTPRGTREFVVKDDQGHTLYFGQDCATAP